MVSLGYYPVEANETFQSVQFEPAFKTGSKYVRPESLVAALNVPNRGEQALCVSSKVQVSPPKNETFGVARWQELFEIEFTSGVTQLVVEMEHKSDWLRSALWSISTGLEDEALRYIALGTTETKTNQEKLERLSDELAQLDLSKLPDIFLVSLLRNTYSFRSSVASWEKLLGKTEQILQNRGQPARTLLRGLRS